MKKASSVLSPKPGRINRAHARTSCMRCERGPIIDLQWADGRGRAWFCKKHIEQFLRSEEREPVRAFLVVDGNIDEKIGGTSPKIWEFHGQSMPEEDLLSAINNALKTKAEVSDKKGEENEKSEAGKLFVYIPLADNKLIENIQAQASDLLAESFFIPVSADKFHLTLLYVDDVSDAQAQEIIKSIDYPAEFSMRLEFLGTFVEADSNPLVLRVHPSEELLNLQARIVSAATQAGVSIRQFSKIADYSPHITIGTELENGSGAPTFPFQGVVPASSVNFAREDFKIIKKVSLKDVPFKYFEALLKHIEKIKEEKANAA